MNPCRMSPHAKHTTAFKKNNPEVHECLIKQAISRTKKVADLTDLKMEVYENTIPILHPADVYETIYAEFNSRCKSKLKKLGLEKKVGENEIMIKIDKRIIDKKQD